MKDKEKQIEEIYNIIVERCINGKDNNGMPTIGCVNQMAENIYNAGYRKLPEDSVVLTREEYEELITKLRQRTELLSSYFAKSVRLEEKLKQTSKETTEKIFDILYQWLDLEHIVKYGSVTIHKFDFLRKFREICKQFGVEIKE